jgi:HD superfamily phosphohydrolase
VAHLLAATDTLFLRFKELLAAAASPQEKKALVPEAPNRVVLAFSGQMSLSDYLTLDDHSITEFLKACAEAKDEVIRRLGDNLLNRRLFKSVEATQVFQAGEAGRISDFDREVRERFGKLGLDPRFHFADDNPGDTPYKPYDPDARNPATQIYVEGPGGKPVEIGTVSDTVAQLRKQYVLVRYYFPPEHRDTVEKIAANTLFKG